MTEVTQVRAQLRRHIGPLLRLVPFSAPAAMAQSGIPDHYWIGRGASGWIESKMISASGKPPAHFVREQLMWAEEEVRWGGRWHLIGLVLRQPVRWWLFDARGARDWFDGRWPPEPVVDVAGKFPTREVLRALIGSRSIANATTEPEEIEVTREMIEAGVEEYALFDSGDPGEWVVEAIYREMERIHRLTGDSPPFQSSVKCP